MKKNNNNDNLIISDNLEKHIQKYLSHENYKLSSNEKYYDNNLNSSIVGKVDKLAKINNSSIKYKRLNLNQNKDQVKNN
jgi:hypothetical protein